MDRSLKTGTNLRDAKKKYYLFRLSIFPKLTLFLYLSLFITYLCFCFNCKCRSVNIYQLFHLTPCYKRAFFLCQYQNARATFVYVVVCLKVDLTHVLLISRTFNSDNFLRATYITKGIV